MQDAAELCERVAFIVNGQIYAMDTPRNLIMSKEAVKVTYTYMDLRVPGPFDEKVREN